MDLKVKPASTYVGSRPPYSLPLEIGCFSKNYENEYTDDSEQMKFIVMPDKLKGLQWDLNEGYADFIDKVEHEGRKFHSILKWILNHEGQVKKYFIDSSAEPKLDFVCFRGVLTTISKTIYENNENSEDWMIYASKFRSVIYLRKNDTEQHKQIEMNAGKKGHLWTTYGFKFEQFMTSGEIDSKPNTSVPVNENEKYFTVMKVKFDNHRLLFGAEVDGVDPEHLKDPRQDPKSTLRYVELKTSMLITSSVQRRNFNRYKLLKWYLQSYFIGILRVICGFRDRDGIVRELGVYNVRDMPRMAEGLWSSSACLRFCSEFLNFVKKCAVKDDPKVVYRFYYKPGFNITCEELQIEEERILPDWYTESVKVI